MDNTELAAEKNEYGLRLRQQNAHHDSVEYFREAIRLSPNNSEYYSNLSLALFDLGDWPGLESITQKASSLEPNDPDHFFRLGLALKNQSKFEEAIHAFESVLNLKPSSVNSWIQIEIISCQLKNLSQAVYSLENALQLDPENLYVLGRLAELYYDDSRYEEAIKKCETLLIYVPQDATAWAKIGQISHEIGENEKAITAYRTALIYNPEYMFVLESLANLLFEMNRNEEAFELLERLDLAGLKHNKKPNGNFESWSDLIKFTWAKTKSSIGHRYFLKDETAEAVKFFREAVNITPDEFQFQIDLGRALNELEEWDEAIKVWEKLITSKPSLLLAYIYLSKAYSKSEKFNEAKECLDHAETMPLNESDTVNYIGWSNLFGTFVPAFDDIGYFLNASRSMFYFDLGNWYTSQCLYEEAVSNFKKCIEINSEDGDSYLNLGNAFNNLGRYEEAEEAYKQTIRCEPNDGQAYFYLGIICLKQKKTDEAIEALEESVLLSPNNSRAWYNLGFAYSLNNRYDETINALQQSLALDSNDTKARNLIGMAYHLKGDSERSEQEIRILEKLDPDSANNLSKRIQELKIIEKTKSLLDNIDINKKSPDLHTINLLSNQFKTGVAREPKNSGFNAIMLYGYDDRHIKAGEEVEGIFEAEILKYPDDLDLKSSYAQHLLAMGSMYYLAISSMEIIHKDGGEFIKSMGYMPSQKTAQYACEYFYKSNEVIQSSIATDMLAEVFLVASFNGTAYYWIKEAG